MAAVSKSKSRTAFNGEMTGLVVRQGWELVRVVMSSQAVIAMQCNDKSTRPFWKMVGKWLLRFEIYFFILLILSFAKNTIREQKSPIPAWLINVVLSRYKTKPHCCFIDDIFTFLCSVNQCLWFFFCSMCNAGNSHGLTRRHHTIHYLYFLTSSISLIVTEIIYYYIYLLHMVTIFVMWLIIYSKTHTVPGGSLDSASSVTCPLSALICGLVDKWEQFSLQWTGKWPCGQTRLSPQWLHYTTNV